MTDSGQKERRLHLVRQIEVATVRRAEPTQLALFAEGPTVFFLYTGNLSEWDFLDALRVARADCVLDARGLPRFDFGRLNRRYVFELFAGESTAYHALDIAAHGASTSMWAGSGCVHCAAAAWWLIGTSNAPGGHRRTLVLCDDRQRLGSLLDDCRTRAKDPENLAIRVLNAPRALAASEP